jgi:hypothetical protein
MDLICLPSESKPLVLTGILQLRSKRDDDGEYNGDSNEDTDLLPKANNSRIHGSLSVTQQLYVFP